MSPRLPPLSPAYLSGEIQEALDLVNRVIEKIRYERLKLTLLEGVNPEINTDREVLVSRIDELGFRHDIVEALGELDRKLAAAGKPLDFKGCMDLARTILEELIEDAAKKAAAIKKEPLPPANAKSNFVPWKNLLVSCGVITADEAELLQKLYNYISNAGTHRLGSAPEQARVAKNTVIELGLLVAGRVRASPESGASPSLRPADGSPTDRRPQASVVGHG